MNRRADLLLSMAQLKRIKPKAITSGLKELREKAFGQTFPIKPKTLNLLVNDICNSRCEMCLIWKQKKTKEITPEELSTVLSDDLFTELEYVGVSGGEPTLRPDLPEIYRSICQKQPKIIGTGIITNGIVHEMVKKRVLDSADVCKSYGVGFNVMVSLDGVGEIHDLVRGRKNNYQTALSLLNFFQSETDIPASFGCTITSTNAPYVDELLDFAQARGLYGRFRVAEYIDRLYNSQQTEFIKSFDDQTRYNLGLFFFRLEHEFETDPTFKKTYRNIRSMLCEGRPRSIGCPYQSKAVVLTSRGELLYCSPKSPVLGSALETPAETLYLNNIKKRKDIIKKDCGSCIHDYHEPPTMVEKLGNAFEQIRSQKYQFPKLLDQAMRLESVGPKSQDVSSLDSKSVLIVGWYGTETVGDKAILWAIIKELRERKHPPPKIILSSLYPFVSKRTAKEMNLGDILIVETYSSDFERACEEADEVVVGGGPLMDIEPLNHILFSFIVGKKGGALTRVDGCGVGPLKSPVYTRVVSEIVRLADIVTVRDSASLEKAKSLVEEKTIRVVPDPASRYVEAFKGAAGDLNHDTTSKQDPKLISCFLREWTTEYMGDLAPNEFASIKIKFEEQVQVLLAELSQALSCGLHFLPMHTFSVGGDDRRFNRKLAGSIAAAAGARGLEISLNCARDVVSPEMILRHMSAARMNVCMRFHSVLFAETLRVPYIAIDYTNGGKIYSFLREKGSAHKCLSLFEIASGAWQAKLQNLIY